ncbi:MAG: SurA N-terminal domain-containing protein [Oceanospirillaceae bacterium]|nr:SurA N-terminal domain-containing protein [Oceanospirillaceae bacterium]
MLQSIRDNSQSIVAKVIVGLIIVTFALFGVESLISLTTGSKAPASVNGEDIGEQELFRAVELQRRQILAQMGENADPASLDDNMIRSMVLDNLVEQAVLVQSAQEQGMAVSPQMIDRSIVTTPEFQVDGSFDRNQFEAVLRTVGLTPLTYRDYLRKETLIQQERTGYSLSAFVTDSQVEALMQLDRQTRNLSYFELPEAAVRAGVEVSRDEVAQRYDAQKSLYRTEEQVKIQYLLLDKSELAKDIEVTDAELQGQYQQLLAGFESQEQRQAAHILIEINDNRDADAALAEAQALKQQLDEGADFAELAREHSDDLGSASAGGELGLNGRGVFVGPFEDALFALKEGEISAPVRTEFGYHLIKLEQIEQTELPSFEESKAELRQQVIDQKAEGRYVELLEQLADLSFSSGNLDEPAEALQLEIQSSEPFSRAGGSDVVTANAKVIDAAFSDELLNDGVNSSPIELDAGRSVVIRVQEHMQPRQLELDEVAEDIRQELLDQKTAQQLDAQVAGLLERLRQGEAIAAVADETGQALVELTDVSRSSQSLAPAIRSELFRLPHPAEGGSSFGSVELASGGRAIVALTAVNAPEAQALSDDEKRAMRRFLASRQGQQDYQDLVRALKDAAEIEIN